MQEFAGRIGKWVAALAVVAVLGFGGYQVAGTAAVLGHCDPYPGPPDHCVTNAKCEDLCEGAQIAFCNEDNCCECIF